MCKCNLRFTLVSVLCNKLTSMSCKHVVFYLTLSAFCKIYHFPDVSKMIAGFLSCINTCIFRFFNYILKVAPLGITQ